MPVTACGGDCHRCYQPLLFLGFWTCHAAQLHCRVLQVSCSLKNSHKSPTSGAALSMPGWRLAPPGTTPSLSCLTPSVAVTGSIMPRLGCAAPGLPDCSTIGAGCLSATCLPTNSVAQVRQALEAHRNEKEGGSPCLAMPGIYKSISG